MEVGADFEDVSLAEIEKAKEEALEEERKKTEGGSVDDNEQKGEKQPTKKRKAD